MMMFGIVLLIIGLLIFSGGVSLFKSGNYDGGIVWPIVASIVIIIGIIKTITGYQESVCRNNEERARNERENIGTLPIFLAWSGGIIREVSIYSPIFSMYSTGKQNFRRS